MSELERQREANIAKNRALLEQLNLSGNTADELGVPQPAPKAKPKPVAAATRKKRKAEDEEPVPRRASTRPRRSIRYGNETEDERKEREAKEEEQRLQAEEEQLVEDEKRRKNSKPRHEQLDLGTLVGNEVDDDELEALRTHVKAVCKTSHPLRTGDDSNDWGWDDNDEERDDSDLAALKDACKSMRVVSRAKVTKERIYSMAYHPERTKDLIFYGEKQGRLGIWDARAEAAAKYDSDGDLIESDEGGRRWSIQLHWPANSKSSISNIKFDPLNAHSLFTTSYDCTVRQWSFTTGMSRELLSFDGTLISGVDVVPTGNEIWVSDNDGGVTHMDIRQHKSQAKRFQLAQHKIGSVSVNPVQPNLLLTACNNRTLKIWDVRKLNLIPFEAVDASIPRPPTDEAYPIEIEYDDIQKFIETPKGKGAVKGDWAHGAAVLGAYWNPTGRFIVSTCYDDKLRYWNVWPGELRKDGVLKTFKPGGDVTHDCQTGRWLTVFRAQWSPNPEAYPHFTVGNMKHSLDVYTFKGELVAKLRDENKITAVQAVTASHPSILARAASGNASGRCVLWADTE